MSLEVRIIHCQIDWNIICKKVIDLRGEMYLDLFDNESISRPCNLYVYCLMCHNKIISVLGKFKSLEVSDSILMLVQSSVGPTLRDGGRII